MLLRSNYGNLINIETDLHQQGPAFKFLHHAAINHFYRANKDRLQIANDTLTRLRRKYIETDEKGKLRTIDKADGTQEFIWKTAHSKSDFDKEVREFLSIQIEIIS